MKINRIFILITMAVIIFAISSALPAHDKDNEIVIQHHGIESGCSKDDHCKDNERCVNKKCIDVCHPYPCGESTGCKAINHRAQCFCLYEYKGDPYTRCTRMSDEEVNNKMQSEFGEKSAELWNRIMKEALRFRE